MGSFPSLFISSEGASINTSEIGLSPEEAQKRIDSYNEISERRVSPITKVIKKFRGIIPWMLRGKYRGGTSLRVTV
jgi:hypothetical protein